MGAEAELLALRDQVAHWRQSAFEAMLAQGRERDRLAAGLHDDIGQLLAMVGFKLGELGDLPELTGSARGLLLDARGLLQQAAKSVRSATFELSNPVLEQLGLKPALQGLAQAIDQRQGLRTVVSGDAPAVLAEPMRGVLYRVTRELLLNVQKHARARHIWLTLHTQAASHGQRGPGEEFALEVADDGVGMAPAAQQRHCGPEGGFGLAHARCQMQAIGGQLLVGAREGGGTQVRLSLPLGEWAHAQHIAAGAA